MLQKLSESLNKTNLSSLHKAEVIRIHNKIYKNTSLERFSHELVIDTNLSKDEILQVVSILVDLI